MWKKSAALITFKGDSPEREWKWQQFNETSDDPSPLLLYKLHGSVDWYFAEDGKVKYFDSPSPIESEQVALIFGTSYKLQYIDPFLFCAYELRRWTLDSARVIVCIGYGFNDDHINGILEQALRQDRKKMLLAVVGPGNDFKNISEKKRICIELKAETNQVVAKACKAKEFLENGLTIHGITALFPPEDDLFPPLPDSSIEKAVTAPSHDAVENREQKQ